MKNLELLKDLNQQFEMTFVEENGVRVCEWVGFENESSIRKGLKSLGLLEQEKELKKLQRQGKLEMMFDDEVMHFTFLLDNPMDVVEKLDLDWDDNWGWKRSQGLV
mgnify:CR=1 FL=1|tara:strand:+ start:5305 stop:5622 length:318 start_codon:yes stop_codon:yes gene_type:complete